MVHCALSPTKNFCTDQFTAMKNLINTHLESGSHTSWPGFGALGLGQKCQAALGFKIAPSCECGPSVRKFELSGCLTLLHCTLGRQNRVNSCNAVSVLNPMVLAGVLKTLVGGKVGTDPAHTRVTQNEAMHSEHCKSAHKC